MIIGRKLRDTKNNHIFDGSNLNGENV